MNVNVLRAGLISIFITSGAEVLTLLLAFPAAYAVARIQTRLSTLVESIFSLGFLIPGTGDLDADLYDDCQGRIVVSSDRPGDPLPGFQPAHDDDPACPASCENSRANWRKSAVIDGGNVLQIIFYLFLPICIPGIVTVLVLNFINIWNEYLFALILMDSKNRTIQLALALLRANQRSVDFGLIAAGVLISMIPVYIVFIFFQERIMSGMLAGAVKE